MNIDWKTFKKFVDDTETKQYINFVNLIDSYYLWLTYENQNLSVMLSKQSTDCEDFIKNYKPYIILKKDLAGDGQRYAKITHVESGRLLKALYCMVSTSSKQHNDKTGYISIKLYDSNGKSTDDESLAVETAVDFFPKKAYEIYGGGVTNAGILEHDIYLSSIFAPDIPAEYGGSVQNVINKKILKPNESTFIYGVGTAEVSYNEKVPAANKMRIKFSHPAGIKCGFQIELQYYM